MEKLPVSSCQLPVIAGRLFSLATGNSQLATSHAFAFFFVVLRSSYATWRIAQ